MGNLIKKYSIYILFTFFLIGVFLRFYYGLNTDLWGDEAVSFFIAKDTSWLDLFFSAREYTDYNHPPGYYMILKFFLAFTYEDFYLRLISLSLFFPSAYLVWLIGKKLGGKQNALIALSIFSIHPSLINLSFQVRPYALALFLVLLSIYLFLITKKTDLLLQVLLGLSLSLAFFVSYASIWLILAIAIVLCWRVLIDRENFSIDHFFSLIVFGILAIFQITTIISVYFDRFAGGLPIAGSIVSFDWQKFIHELGLIVGLDLEIISLFLLVVLPIIFLIKYKKENKLFIFLLFVSSIFLSTIFSVFFSPIFLARQLLVATVGLVFIISSLIVHSKNYIFLLLILLMYAYLSVNEHGLLFQRNIDQIIRNYVEDNGLILTFDAHANSYLDYYLFVNQKKAHIKLIYLDDLDNKQLIEEVLSSSYSNIVFFDNYCPDEKYKQCWEVIETLTYEFCESNTCEFLSDF